jgi:hypothetical protein
MRCGLSVSLCAHVKAAPGPACRPAIMCRAMEVRLPTRASLILLVSVLFCVATAALLFRFLRPHSWRTLGSGLQRAPLVPAPPAHHSGKDLISTLDYLSVVAAFTFLTRLSANRKDYAVGQEIIPMFFQKHESRPPEHPNQATVVWHLLSVLLDTDRRLEPTSRRSRHCLICCCSSAIKDSVALPMIKVPQREQRDSTRLFSQA